MAFGYQILGFGSGKKANAPVDVDFLVIAAGGGGVVRGRVRHRQAITSGSGGRQIASDEESHSSLALTWATNVLSADATIVIDSSGWR